MMETVIVKFGKDIGLLFPDEIVTNGNISAGDTYNVTLAGDTIVLVPTSSVQYTCNIDDLVGKINASNLHTEFSMGNPRGKECV